MASSSSDEESGRPQLDAMEVLLEIDEFKREISLPGPTVLLSKACGLVKSVLNLPDPDVGLAGGSSDFFLQIMVREVARVH